MVPVGQGAGGGVRREILAQPLFLGRAGMTAAHLRTVGVEDHDMPGAQVVAVVTLRAISRRDVEVVKVAAGPAGQVIVVTNGRLGAALVSTPSRVVAVGELLGRAGVVDGIAERGHNPG